MKTIFAKGDSYVWIKTGNSTWSSLPISVRVALAAGLERISMQRRNITKESKITFMPPCEIVPEMWATDAASIDGKMTVIRAPDGFHLGVQLPAQTALCEDMNVVRAVLVHEFLHCFHCLIKNLAGHAISGESPNRDPFSREQDDALLANSSDWLGKHDTDSLIHHDSACAAALHETIVRYMGYFRLVMPDIHLNFSGMVYVEEHAVKLARELIARREFSAAAKGE